ETVHRAGIVGAIAIHEDHDLRVTREESSGKTRAPVSASGLDDLGSGTACAGRGLVTTASIRHDDAMRDLARNRAHRALDCILLVQSRDDHGYPRAAFRHCE